MPENKYLCLVCGKWNAPLDRLYCDEHTCGECGAKAKLFLVDAADSPLCEPCIMSRPAGLQLDQAWGNTDYQKAPVCPWCGRYMDTSIIEEDIKTDCGRCRRPVLVSIHYSITYSTSKMDAAGQDGPASGPHGS